MVEFNIVDLISCLGLESLVDQVVFSVGDPQLLIIEDRSETRVADESAVALVLVLEEWFNQKSSMSNISSDSHHAGIQLGLLFMGQAALWVQDRWSLEG